VRCGGPWVDLFCPYRRPFSFGGVIP
jgi:hypothetical protein